MMNQLSLHELINYAKDSMSRANYSDDYVSKFEKVWKDLKNYLDDNAVTFSIEVGELFLEGRYNILRDVSHNSLKKSDQIRRRAMLILYNCQKHNKISISKDYCSQEFACQFEKPFINFISRRKNSGIAYKTVERDNRCLNILSTYLDDLGIKDVNEMESSHILGFMKYAAISRKIPTLAGIATSMRLFLRFLYEEDLVPNNLEPSVPKVKRKYSSIPSAFTKQEILHLLESIDRSSPKGKRDYAIIMLAAKLGMRASDICNLTFDNLKWQTNTIEFAQQKTGKQATLPLLNDIGVAIIEYIKYARPNADTDFVFLRFQTPVKRMKPSSLHQIVELQLRKASIVIPEGKRHGPHALRASLASAMLDNHTPLPVISEALTHENSDTTKIYLKIDLSHLREYSLEVPPMENVWMGGSSK